MNTQSLCHYHEKKYSKLTVHYEFLMGKKFPEMAASMHSRAGHWESWLICIALRHNRGAPVDMLANVLGILIICRFPVALFILYTRIGKVFLWHHVPSSAHLPSQSFSCHQPHFTELSRARTWIAAVCWWVILLSGFRQIVAGTLRGGSKVLCQMEDEYIGNISYKFRDPRGRVP